MNAWNEWLARELGWKTRNCGSEFKRLHGGIVQKSEQVNELFAALAKARANFDEVKKTESNPFYKSKYADLATIISATYKSLSAQGLSVIQLLGDVANGAVIVETILTHASGQWLSTETSMPVQKSDAQGVGSALTYCRRYSLQSILNIAAEEDDDGSAAVSKSVKDVKAAEQRFDNARISPVNVREFWKVVRKSGWTNDQVAAYLANLGYKQTEEIKQSQYDLCLKWAASPPPVPQDLLPALNESLDMAKAKKATGEAVKPDPAWKTFWQLAKRHGVPEADVHKYATEHFGMKQSLTELTPLEVGKIAEWIAGVQP